MSLDQEPNDFANGSFADWSLTQPAREMLRASTLHTQCPRGTAPVGAFTAASATGPPAIAELSRAPPPPNTDAPPDALPGSYSPGKRFQDWGQPCLLPGGFSERPQRFPSRLRVSCACSAPSPPPPRAAPLLSRPLPLPPALAHLDIRMHSSRSPC